MVEQRYPGCFRRLVLLVCLHLHLKSALMPVLLQTGTCEAKLGRNVLAHRALSPSQQHSMPEAPIFRQMDPMDGYPEVTLSVSY